MKRILVALLLLAASSLLSTNINAKPDVEVELRKLVTSGESAAFTRVGHKTMNELRKRNVSGCHYTLYAGDVAQPFGDNKASHHVVISCLDMDNLVIRLNLESEESIHILGFLNRVD